MAPPAQFADSVRPLCFTPDDRKLFVSVSGLGETVWSIDLARTPLGPAELAAKFSSLGDLPLVAAEAALRWHSESATVAERQGAWFTAAFHLQRLLAASPEDNALRERLEMARSELLVQPRR